MFIFIKNYKNLLFCLIKNNLERLEANDSFEWGELEDLKLLQKALKDWILDPEEAKKISDEVEQIEWDAREWLNSIIEKIVEEGFACEDADSYNSYKNLIEKNWKKIPSWDELIKQVREEWEDPNDDFNWVIVNKDNIKIRVNQSWSMKDTLVIKYDENAQITNKVWKKEAWEDNKTGNKAKVEKNLMDDKINKNDAKNKARKEINIKPQSLNEGSNIEELIKINYEHAKNELENLINNNATVELVNEATQNLKNTREELDSAINEANKISDAKNKARAELEIEVQSLNEGASIDNGIQENFDNTKNNLNALISIEGITSAQLDSAIQNLVKARNELDSAINEANKISDAKNKAREELEIEPTVLNQGASIDSSIQKSFDNAKTELENALNNQNPKVEQIINATQNLKNNRERLESAINEVNEISDAKNKAREELDIEEPILIDGTEGVDMELKANFDNAKIELENLINNNSKAEQIINATQNLKNNRERLESAINEANEISDAKNKAREELDIEEPILIDGAEGVDMEFKINFDNAKTELENELNNQNPTVEKIKDATQKLVDARNELDLKISANNIIKRAENQLQIKPDSLKPWADNSEVKVYTKWFNNAQQTLKEYLEGSEREPVFIDAKKNSLARALKRLNEKIAEANENIPKEIIHTVWKGETLWKIVKKHYWLENKTEIAKMVNFVVDSQIDSKMAKRLWKDEDPKNFRDGIKWDKIWVWDKIKLLPKPQELEKIKKSTTWPREIEKIKVVKAPKPRNEKPKIKTKNINNRDIDKNISKLNSIDIDNNTLEKVKKLNPDSSWTTIKVWEYKDKSWEIKDILVKWGNKNRNTLELDGSSNYWDLDISIWEVKDKKYLEKKLKELLKEYNCLDKRTEDDNKIIDTKNNALPWNNNWPTNQTEQTETSNIKEKLGAKIDKKIFAKIKKISPESGWTEIKVWKYKNNDWKIKNILITWGNTQSLRIELDDSSKFWDERKLLWSFKNAKDIENKIVKFVNENTKNKYN